MGANAPRRLPPLLLLLLPLLLLLLLLLLLQPLSLLCGMSLARLLASLLVCVFVFWFVRFVADGTLARWLRCRPAEPMESPRLGSNPKGVV